MAGWEEGAGFRVVGCVVRTFVAKSGKFAKLTVDVAVGPHPPKIEFKTLDRIVVGDVNRLQKGQRVQVRGRIEMEKVQDRQYDDVKVDGYPVWVPVLRPSSIEVEGSSRSPAPADTPRNQGSSGSQTSGSAPAESGDDFAPSGGFDAPDGEL